MNDNSLAALHVLVTRPVPQQQELVSAIEAAGGHALHLPLLAIRSFTLEDRPAELVGKIQNLDHFQLLVFVSLNAVQHGVNWIAQYWPQFPVGIQLVAIGPGTARALTTALQQDVLSAGAGATSEDLLQLPVFADVQGKRIGIVRGIGGRELLAQTLRERGAVVEYVEVYERSLVPYMSAAFTAQLQAHGINVLTASSGESLQYLATLLGDNKAEMSLLPLLVPSPRVAEQARAAGFTHVIQTHGADVESWMTALRKLPADIGRRGARTLPPDPDPRSKG